MNEEIAYNINELKSVKNIKKEIEKKNLVLDDSFFLILLNKDMKDSEFEIAICFILLLFSQGNIEISSQKVDIDGFFYSYLIRLVTEADRTPLNLQSEIKSKLKITKNIEKQIRNEFEKDLYNNHNGLLIFLEKLTAEYNLAFSNLASYNPKIHDIAMKYISDDLTNDEINNLYCISKIFLSFINKVYVESTDTSKILEKYELLMKKNIIYKNTYDIVTQENNKLKDKLNSFEKLELENEELRKRLENKESYISKLEFINEEKDRNISNLENYINSLDTTIDLPDKSNDIISILNDNKELLNNKIVLVCENDNFNKNIKLYLSNITLINSLNFDANIIKNSKYVFINTNLISHAMLFKCMKISSNFVYLSSKNTQSVALEIIDKIKKD